jgi:hypothetical protein
VLKASAQPAPDQAKFVDQTIEYLTRLSSISTAWTNDPKKTGYRKEMHALVTSYDVMKSNLVSVLILKDSDDDRKTVEALLASYDADRKRLVDELLLWKYRIKPIASTDLLAQLDDINEAAKAILLNFQNDETMEDAISVLLSQDAAESRIVPLSKDVIGKLQKFK